MRIAKSPRQGFGEIEMSALIHDEERFRREFILASAFFHAPSKREPVIANSARVLMHALKAAGLWEDRLREAFHGVEDDETEFALVSRWYATLIEMTQFEPAEERLLDGCGNFGTPPAGAYYTACWLTDAGRRISRHLVEIHPEWTEQLTSARK
jgi:hypothetical protein